MICDFKKKRILKLALGRLNESAKNSMENIFAFILDSDDLIEYSDLSNENLIYLFLLHFTYLYFPWPAL